MTPLRARDVPCLWCNARVGEACRDRAGYVVAEHAARRRSAIKQQETSNEH